MHSLRMTTVVVVGAELRRVRGGERPGSRGSRRARRRDAADDVRLNMCAVAVCVCRAATSWLLRTVITQGYVTCGWSDGYWGSDAGGGGGGYLAICRRTTVVVVTLQMFSQKCSGGPQVGGW